MRALRVSSSAAPCGLSVTGASTVLTLGRSISTGEFDHPPFQFRQKHTFNTLPLHDANRFGGRTAYLREIGPFDQRRKGRLFKKDPQTVQFNVDVWAAQQTLRKRWKARDWDIMELPFSAAPKALQRVIPELYTDIPQMTNPAGGDFSNVRHKVYDREGLQDVLYGQGNHPYPRIASSRTTAAHMTLDKML